eukprot:3160316-Alexandrium_andersonii.AAC.1
MATPASQRGGPPRNPASPRRRRRCPGSRLASRSSLRHARARTQTCAWPPRLRGRHLPRTSARRRSSRSSRRRSRGSTCAR